MSGRPPELARRLGTADAVVLGLGSMLGAGVFAAFAPAAQAAGSGLLLGLAIAAGVAFCNATSSAQLAAQYPTSGGAYVYGRARLGPWWGFLAGWCFVVGKTASCAAMALAFAAYAVPDGPVRLVAVSAVVVLAAVNHTGVTRTAGLTRVLLGVVLVALATVVLAAVLGGQASVERLRGSGGLLDRGAHGILQSAGLLFFAFAGYARVATLGEEVRDPGRTVPRAVLLALALALALYAAVAAAVLGLLGPVGVAASPSPLADAVAVGGWAQAEPVVRVGAAAGSLGALLALMAGIGRTGLAMAREGDLPRWLAAVHPVHAVPHRAGAALAAGVAVLVLVADLRAAIGASSFGVLLYYGVANAAAATQSGEHRRWPRVLQLLGGAGCLLLVVTLPVHSVATGSVVVALGLAARGWRLRRGRR